MFLPSMLHAASLPPEFLGNSQHVGTDRPLKFIRAKRAVAAAHPSRRDDFILGRSASPLLRTYATPSSARQRLSRRCVRVACKPPLPSLVLLDIILAAH